MKKLVYALMGAFPVLAMAQTSSSLTSLDDIVAWIAKTIKTLIPVFFGLAIIYFFWGLANFIRASGDAKAQEAGRNQMIWGVIAIAVMISVYGLAIWLQGLFGISSTATVSLPTVPGL